MSSGFAAIRDSRLLTVPEQAEFLRRIPWLAADNGCEERAEAAVYFFHQWDYPTPYFARVRAKPRKRLVFQTTNEPSGTVTWSHHVAPVVRVGGQLMILDVAIDPSRPLPIAEWLSRFSVADDIDVALCRDHASTITDSAVVRRILDHLNLPSQPRTAAPARDPTWEPMAFGFDAA
ncbi:protein-glutamine glutaminase family protein [Sorangium sp. So ce693]